MQIDVEELRRGRQALVGRHALTSLWFAACHPFLPGHLRDAFIRVLEVVHELSDAFLHFGHTSPRKTRTDCTIAVQPKEEGRPIRPPLVYDRVEMIPGSGGRI